MYKGTSFKSEICFQNTKSKSINSHDQFSLHLRMPHIKLNMIKLSFHLSNYRSYGFELVTKYIFLLTINIFLYFKGIVYWMSTDHIIRWLEETLTNRSPIGFVLVAQDQNGFSFRMNLSMICNTKKQIWRWIRSLHVLKIICCLHGPYCISIMLTCLIEYFMIFPIVFLNMFE